MLFQSIKLIFTHTCQICWDWWLYHAHNSQLCLGRGTRWVARACDHLLEMRKVSAQRQILNTLDHLSIAICSFIFHVLFSLSSPFLGVRGTSCARASCAIEQPCDAWAKREKERRRDPTAVHWHSRILHSQRPKTLLFGWGEGKSLNYSCK